MTEGAASPNRAVPLILLTGFLGSGKTTLLRALLRQPENRRAAVVIGEFGEVAIDHHLIRPLDQGAVTLMEGCPCCTLQDDLATTLRMLWRQGAIERSLNFDRIILETSGLSEPGPMLNTILGDPGLAGRVEPAAVLCAVDALHLFDTLDRWPECRRQIALADRLIVTKSDLVDAGQRSEIIRFLESIAGTARIDFAQHGEIAATEPLLEPLAGGQQRFRTAPSPMEEAAARRPAHTHRHGGDIRSFVWTADRPLVWAEAVQALSALVAAHGPAILRLKGLLNIAGTDRPTVVHAIQHRLYPPAYLPEWPDGDRRSRIIVIAEGLDEAAVTARYWRVPSNAGPSF